MFDAISGIFKSPVQAIGGFLGDVFGGIGNFVSDFGGGAFASIDETFRGGTLSPGMAASGARRAGIGLGGIFTDIGTSFITGQVEALTTRPLLRQRTGTPAPAAPRRAETLGEIVARVAPGRGIGGDIVRQIERERAGAISPSARFQPRVAPAPVGDPRATQAGLGELLFDPVFLMEGLRQNVLDPFGLGTAARGIGAAAGGLRDIFTGGKMATALPGGALIPFDPVSPAGGRLFTASQNLMTGRVSVRPIKEIQAMNPSTGRVHTWREKGRCLLFSDDLGAVKRVRKVARLAGRKR